KQRGFFGDITLMSYDLNASYEPSPIQLLPDEIRKITERPGISSVHHFANKAGIINVNDEVEGVLFKGIDGEYDQRFLSDILLDGHPIDFADSTAAGGQILISRYIADRLQLNVGDDFILYFVQERIRPRKFQ